MRNASDTGVRSYRARHVNAAEDGSPAVVSPGPGPGAGTKRLLE